MDKKQSMAQLKREQSLSNLKSVIVPKGSRDPNVDLDEVLFQGNVDKFSMGRAVGFQTKNWKTRFVKVTRTEITYTDKEGSPPKGSFSTQLVSMLIENPGSEVHPEANGKQTMVAARLHDGGVFTLLLRPLNCQDKEKLFAAMLEAVKRFKGVQLIADPIKQQQQEAAAAAAAQQPPPPQ
jgi:hypothetical protein